MSGHKLIVLKFGGSVLTNEHELPTAVHEIYRWVAQGYRVVSVVSALGTTTNQLFEQGRKYGHRLSQATIAKLAATGEATSAALLGLALDRVGVTNEVHDETSLGIRTEGNHRLDSSIVEIDKGKFEAALSRVNVIVVPGFVGRNDQGSVELLGRGGSDLTALFLANSLDADECRLVKDVDGLFEWDPKRSGSPRQFADITFDGALELDETIVQHKAVRFAKDHRVEFEVGSLRSSYSTKVGQFDTDRYFDEGRRPEPLKLGLLGLGTVGLGFFRHASKFPSVRIQKIAVRDLIKAESNGAPIELITNDPISVIQDDTDIVVELIGGIEPALTLVRSALKSGKHVITANKSLVARHGVELEAISKESGAELCFAGSVGGGVPMIENVRRIAAEEPIVGLEGVLNGTCNFVLDKIAQNVSFGDAVLAAQREGFAEADPSKDLNGTDAAEKLVILARAAGFDIQFDEVDRQSIDQELVSQWQSQSHPDEVLRQVSSLTVEGDEVRGCVQIKPLPLNHRFANAQGEDNRLVIHTGEGESLQLSGRGAGRFPTSQAVVNDLINLVREFFLSRAEKMQLIDG